LTINLPPLRERKEDIPLLCELFINRFNKTLKKDIQGLAPEPMSRLLNYSWPGNVRELENLIERAMVLADDSQLTVDQFPKVLNQQDREDLSETLFKGFSLKHAQRVMEKKLITKALAETNGNRNQAARLLEISYPSLLNKIKIFDIAV